MTCFFVGGSQRAGTSLLQSVLCQDATTNPHILEASFLRAMVSAYQFGKASMGGDAAHYFVDAAAMRDFCARWVDEFLENTRTLYAPAEHLVLKEPHLTMFFPELAELVAGARFLVVLRDPRDCIASMIDVGRKQTAQGVPNMFAKRDMVELSNHYKSFYAPVVNSQSETLRANTCFVKYEALVIQPDIELEKLRAFTGLALDGVNPAEKPDSSRIDYDNLSTEHGAWATHLSGQGISSDRIGRYATVLTAAEVAVVERECTDVLQMFKYSGDEAPAA